MTSVNRVQTPSGAQEKMVIYFRVNDVAPSRRSAQPPCAYERIGMLTYARKSMSEFGGLTERRKGPACTLLTEG